MIDIHGGKIPIHIYTEVKVTEFPAVGFLAALHSVAEVCGEFLGATAVRNRMCLLCAGLHLPGSRDGPDTESG